MYRSGKCPSGMCLVGEVSIGDASGRGNVRQGIVRRGSVRRECVRRVRTPFVNAARTVSTEKATATGSSAASCFYAYSLTDNMLSKKKKYLFLKKRIFVKLKNCTVIFKHQYFVIRMAKTNARKSKKLVVSLRRRTMVLR